MAEACSALNEVPAILRLHLNLLRKLQESLVLHAQLAEASLSPSPDVSFLGDSKTEERPAGYVADRPAIEGVDIVRCRGDLNALADSKLSFEATTPRVHVGLISEHKGVVLSASDLNDALVSQWLENGGGEGTLGTAVAHSALDAGAVGEDVSVTSQVEGMVAAALHEHQVAHVLLLLGAGRPEWLLARALAVHRVLHKLLAVLECEHLRRLFLMPHVLVLLKLMGHFGVHFGPLVVVVMTEVVLVIGHSLVEAVCCGVCTLHAVGPLGPVGRVSERLSFLNALVDHHVLLLLRLGKLVEVLLLLVKG